MKPIFYAIMYSKCTTVDGEESTCPYSVSLYPDMSYKIRWCSNVMTRGTLEVSRYSANHFLQILEFKLQNVIKENADNPPVTPTAPKRREDDEHKEMH